METTTSGRDAMKAADAMRKTGAPAAELAASHRKAGHALHREGCRVLAKLYIAAAREYDAAVAS